MWWQCRQRRHLYLAPNTPTTLYGDLKVTGGTVTLTSGTYFFYNANITINGGTVTGTNVNIVLLGDSTISISGGATVALSANFSNTTYPDLNGVLFDDQAPNKSSLAVTINGGSGSHDQPGWCDVLPQHRCDLERHVTECQHSLLDGGEQYNHDEWQCLHEHSGLRSRYR